MKYYCNYNKNFINKYAKIKKYINTNCLLPNVHWLLHALILSL